MPTNVKLLVSHCSTCKSTTIPCVRLGVIDLCKSCDKSGSFVSLSTYKKAV